MLLMLSFLPYAFVQINWNSWASVPLAVTPDFEAFIVIASKITQPLEGEGLRVLYLVE